MIKRTNRKLISFSDRNLDMMEAISAQTGLDSATAIVKRAIEELHYKYVKPYGSANPVITEEAVLKNAEIKAKAKSIEKKTEEAFKDKDKIDICTNILGGAVSENSDGKKVCTFTQYTLKGDNEVTLPLSQVNNLIAETSLFMPSREAVFKNRPEVKDKFN